MTKATKGAFRNPEEGKLGGIPGFSGFPELGRMRLMRRNLVSGGPGFVDERVDATV